MKINIIALLAVIICGINAAGDLQFQRIGIEKGLSQSSVQAITQDKAGYLWVATWEGLNRFDGYKFEQYHTKPVDTALTGGDYVSCVYSDKSDNIWAGISLRFIRFRSYNSNRFLVKDLLSWLPRPDLLSMLHFIAEDSRGDLWFASSYELLRIRADGHKDVYLFPKEQSNTAGFKTRDGRLWFICRNAIARVDENTNSLVYYKHQGSLGGYNQKTINFNCGSQDSRGNIWIGTNGAGVYRFLPATGRFVRSFYKKDDASGLSSNEISDIFEDSRKRLWIGTANGLNMLFPNDTCILDKPRIEKFYCNNSDPTSLSSNQITRLFEDRSGVLWIGTQVGLNKLKPSYKNFVSYNTGKAGNELAGQPICFLEGPCGSLYVGSTEGLYFYNSERKVTKIFTPQNSGLSSLRVWSLFRDSKNTLWVGTPNGLNRLDESTGRFISVSDGIKTESDKLKTRVYAIIENEPGCLCYGCDYGLGFYNTRSGTHSFYTDSSTMLGRGGLVVLCLTTDKIGNLWCGTDGFNLARFNPAAGKFTYYKTDTKNPEYIGNTKVMSVYLENDSVVWLATLGGGIKRISISGGNISGDCISTEMGLANSYCYSVIKDRRGCFWISTNNCLSMYDPINKTIKNYSVSDGLPANEFIQNAAYLGPSGKMYFGTVKGFVEFFPESISLNPYIPPIVITGFRIFDENRDQMLLNEEIVLQYHQNFFSFEFASLSFDSPEKNKYAYMLEGFDDRWRYPGDRRYASYTNLDPGEYIFHVIGSNNDGVWNTTGAKVKIRIIPPFYATWWFKSIAILFVLILLGGIIAVLLRRKYNKQITQLEKEKAVLTERQMLRDKIARDLHDDLASTVSSAGLFVETAKIQVEKNNSLALEYMQKTSTLIAEAEDTISEIVWAVSPKHDKLQSLCARLRQYISEILRANNINLVTEASIGNEDFPINEETRRGIYLIVKEAVNNIIKHSGADKVVLTLELEFPAMRIVIEDNGSGFVQEGIIRGKGGNGVGNMHKRAAELNAKFELISMPGKGTSIAMSVNLTQLSH